MSSTRFGAVQDNGEKQITLRTVTHRYAISSSLYWYNYVSSRTDL